MTSETHENDSIEFRQGDVVTDCKKGKEVVVVHCSDELADEYVVWDTPANDDPICVDYFNDGYPADDPVVEAVYVEATIFDEDEVVRAFDAGEIDEGMVYSFPVSRLEK